MLSKRDGSVQRLEPNSSCYDPLAYIVYHMSGKVGWTYNQDYFYKRMEDGTWVGTNRKVTAMDYYSYRAHPRDAKGEVG
jgi:hypothetical protein